MFYVVFVLKAYDFYKYQKVLICGLLTYGGVKTRYLEQ